MKVAENEFAFLMRTASDLVSSEKYLANLKPSSISRKILFRLILLGLKDKVALFKIGDRDRFCHSNRETFQHLLFECEQFRELGNQNFGADWRSLISVKNKETLFWAKTLNCATWKTTLTESEQSISEILCLSYTRDHVVFTYWA